MTDEERVAAGVCLETALELAELAAEMTECRLRREHPDATDEELAELVAVWYATRPGAMSGDAPGKPVHWPRR